MAAPGLLERALGFVAPGWALKRTAARAASTHVRNYEAAAVGRRTSGWHRGGADANSVMAPALAYIRNTARHLVRNNPYAESAVATIADHVVGTGITAKPRNRKERTLAVWREWAESTQCDADGVNDFAGLEALAVRTIAESGEVLIRRRWRRLEDGFPLPLQIQILEPDYLDTSRDRDLPGGGRIVQGVEFDMLGRRVAYHLLRDHPGSNTKAAGFFGSSRVPADDVLHVFRSTRAGQVRAVSWFAPVLLKMRDFDEYDDASLMKQKIAACLAVLTFDTEGTDDALGTRTAAEPMIETLEPGMITKIGAGQSVEVVQPPAVNDYEAFAAVQLRAIATGLGVAYEDLTGDYAGMPFSAARMSRLRHWLRVDGWRWRMVIPRMCAPVWAWAMAAAVVAGRLDPADVGPAEWTAPPPPMLDADKEIAAIVKKIRGGLTSWAEAVRELGVDPDELLDEIKAGNAKLDAFGIVLDSDPRVMSGQGQKHSAAAEAAPPAPAPKSKAKQDDEGGDDAPDPDNPPEPDDEAAA